MKRTSQMTSAPIRVSANGHREDSPEQVRVNIERAIDRLDGLNTIDRLAGRFVTARQLATEIPAQPDWRIHGMSARGVITELTGKAKIAGKTTFLGHMARAKLDGKPFLGRATKPGPIVWLTEERGATFRQSLERAGLLDREDLHILTWADTFGVDWPDVCRVALAHAHKVGADTVIVDTLPSFAGLRGDDENSAGAAGEAMVPVQKIAADGLAVIVVRHDRRSGGEVGESGRGSTAFTGAVDIVLHIQRVGGQGRATVRQLDGIGRLDGIPDQLIIQLDADGYRAVGTESDLQRQEARRLLTENLPESGEDAVTLPSLWAAGRDGVPAGPLAGAGIAPSTFRRAADELASEGLLAWRKLTGRKTVWWSVFHGPDVEKRRAPGQGSPPPTACFKPRGS
jgi:hypothetical protein